MEKPDRFARRRARLLRRFRRLGVDALLITGVSNVRYLSGFTGDDSFLLLAPSRATLITDGRYTTQAEEETRSLELLIRKKGIIPTTAGLLRESGLHRIGFESRQMRVAEHEQFKTEAGDDFSLVSTSDEVERLREAKDAHEVGAIGRAIAIAEGAIAEVRGLIRPGVTERRLAGELDAAMRRLGADASAFETIVAAGERAALPHARPTDRAVRPGECILFDWGARLGQYDCDLTRVFFLSRIPATWKRVYGAVLEAQGRAIRAVRAGRLTGEVDAAARDWLKQRRLAGHFTHGLGHGVGLDIHESPALARGGKKRLAAGMVVTVEPGVYLPGRGGVRIEDMVLVTPRGGRVLTSAPKALDEIVIPIS